MNTLKVIEDHNFNSFPTKTFFNVKFFINTREEKTVDGIKLCCILLNNFKLLLSNYVKLSSKGGIKKEQIR